MDTNIEEQFKHPRDTKYTLGHIRGPTYIHTGPQAGFVQFFVWNGDSWLSAEDRDFAEARQKAVAIRDSFFQP